MSSLDLRFHDLVYIKDGPNMIEDVTQTPFKVHLRGFENAGRGSVALVFPFPITLQEPGVFF